MGRKIEPKRRGVQSDPGSHPHQPRAVRSGTTSACALQSSRTLSPRTLSSRTCLRCGHSGQTAALYQFTHACDERADKSADLLYASESAESGAPFSCFCCAMSIRGRAMCIAIAVYSSFAWTPQFMLLWFQLQASTHALATLAHATHAPPRSSCAMDRAHHLATWQSFLQLHCPNPNP